MKKIYSLCALCALLLIPNIGKATDYTIEPKADGADAIKSRAIPLLYNAGNTWGSVSQQIYLASELVGEEASAGNIDAITFYYSASSNVTTTPSARDIQIFLMQVPAEKDSFLVKQTGYSDFLYVSSTNKTAGTRVYNGTLNLETVTTSQTKTVKIDFDDSFPWDGSSNLVLTVFDMSETSNTVSVGGFANIRFLISKTDHARFLSKKWFNTDTDNRAAWLADLSGKEGEMWSSGSTAAKQAANRRYVNKVDFSITPAAVVIPVPSNLRTTSVTTSSARLLWDAATGADSYNVQWGTNSASLDHSASNVTNTYLDIDELDDGTTYYFAVQTVKGEKTSAFSNAVSFKTTAITITYKGIEFEKWNSTTSLPSEEGNYYLHDNVALSAQYILPGNINLCLNGHDIYTETNNIKVPDEAKLAIYDNIGGGRIYGHYIANMSTGYGLISVESGGELVLGEGAVENQYGYDVDSEDPEDPDASYAISINNGASFKLSGAPTISAAKAGIYLLTMVPRITIESGKPLTNISAYSVDASGQTITSGWANMGSVDPNVHFISAKTGYKGILLNAGEVQFVPVSDLDISLNESSADNESKLELQQGREVSLAITRSPLTNAQFNTICLPYDMDDNELQLRFGVGYDLEEFVSSSLDGDELNLTFNKVTELEAGKPYLLQPAINAPALSYLSVTIEAEVPADQTSDPYISFHGTFSLTELTGGNKNLLFLGANNELFWPASTGNLKGFRAYFEVKGDARKAVRARISKKEEHTTDIGDLRSENANAVRSEKIFQNGQILIKRDGKTYNVLGSQIR